MKRIVTYQASGSYADDIWQIAVQGLTNDQKEVITKLIAEFNEVES